MLLKALISGAVTVFAYCSFSYAGRSDTCKIILSKTPLCDCML